MRAFVANCLIFAAVFVMPHAAEAQLTRLLGFGNSSASSRLNSARRVAQPVAASQQAKEIQRLQFSDVVDGVIPEAIPPAATETTEFAIPSASDQMGPITDPAMTPPAPAAEIVAGEVLGQSATPEMLPPMQSVVEYPVESGPISQEPLPIADSFDLGAGQAYDMPIGDMIPSEAEVYSTSNWFRGGRWYSSQEVVLLLRSDLPNVHLAADITDVAAAGANVIHLTSNAISLKDAGFTYEAGTRLSVGKILGRDIANRDHSIDFQFFGLFEYTGRARIEEVDTDPISGSGILTLLGTRENLNQFAAGFASLNSVPGFTDARAQEVLHTADLNSFEINYSISGRPARDRMVIQPDGRWVRHATPSKVRNVLVGLRYIRQNEYIKFTSEGGRNAFDTGVPQEFVDGQGDYRVTTDNDMIGIHLGGEFVQKRTNWLFGLRGRVGGLLNFADRHSRLAQVFDSDGTAAVELTEQNESQSLDDETLTGLVEAGVYMAYYVRPNTSFRIGYQGLYLNGVATAGENLGLIGTFPKFELTGDSLYHGMNVGFEMTW